MASHKISTVIVAHREGFAHQRSEFAGTDTAWHDWDELAAAAEPAAAVPVASTHPLYILYTSGTTGSPKGVVRDSGGYAVAMDWSMRNIYGVGPGSTMLTASDVGWVVGHSYIVYGPLIAGATTVLYEGKPVGTPDAGAFWRLIEEHQVDTFFTAPTALRAIRKADPDGRLLAGHDISSLKNFFVAGERLDPDTYAWAGEKLGVPVIDNWWQTETGWPIASNPVGLELLALKAGSPTVPVPGYDVRILDGLGAEVARRRGGQHRHQAAAAPGHPGHAVGQRRALHRHLPRAVPGLLRHRGLGLPGCGRLPLCHGPHRRRHQRLRAPALHRRHGTGAGFATRRWPNAQSSGSPTSSRASGPAGTWCSRAGRGSPRRTLGAELVAMVRAHIGPVADFREVRIVAALPKTRSGKILRKTMRQIADGKPYAVPSTIEDPAVIEELLPFLRPAG